MNLLLEIYKNPFKYLFFALLIFYVLVYTPYGLEDGDMGSIFGISWSMFNGYFPYKDFVYIKPPFSPYFHSLLLYITEDYAYVINRGLYFVQVFMYSYLASKLLFKIVGISKQDLAYFVAIVGALISIHNYAPMPWNTIDGIFFSVIGLTFLFRNNPKIWHFFLGALFISLGVLCKQSFFFFPVFIVLYLLFFKKFKEATYFVFFGIITALSFIAVLYFNGALEMFFDQMFSFTSGSSLFKTGFRSYYLSVKFNIYYVIGFIILIFLAKKFTSKNVVFSITMIAIGGVFIYLYVKYNAYYTVKYGLIQVLFIASVGLCLVRLFSERSYAFLLLMLSLSWCASISNGFNTPIDFSTPFVFAIVLFAYNNETIKMPRLLGIAIVLFFLGIFYYGYQFPYNDSQRSLLTYNMDAIFPRLKGVKSDKETYNKYKELQELSQEYSNFTILPSVTLGHYITNTTNPIGVDWVFNHHLANQLPNYIHKLEDENITVFLENFENHIDNYEETSNLTVYVRDKWKLIETRTYFRVYQKE